MCESSSPHFTFELDASLQHVVTRALSVQYFAENLA